MPRQVAEIMNAEVLGVHAEMPAVETLEYIRAYRVTAAPVLDIDNAALGMVSMRDLLGALEGRTTRECMTAPAVTVNATDSIRDAGRLMCGRGLHRAPVVEKDTVVGMLSLIDVTRALLGLPAAHPESFPHLDPSTGLVWTDDLELSAASIEAHAPDGPGLLALVHGGAWIRDSIVWAESCENVRRRLLELVSSTAQPYPVSALMQHRTLWFRTALVPDPTERARALGRLRDRPWHPSP